MPALILIIAGSCGIILTANFAEVTYTVEILKESMTTAKSMVFTIFTVAQIIFSILILKW